MPPYFDKTTFDRAADFAAAAAAAKKATIGAARPVVICGPSGVGKSTLINRLMSEFPDDFGFVVSHTTRNPRPGEVDGVAYNFVTRESMEAAIVRNEFIEHAEVYGNLYGTSFAAVKRLVDEGRVCVLDIGVQGARSVQARADFDAKYVFVEPPSAEELERRLRGRGTESEESLRTRMSNAHRELEASKSIRFDARIVNDDLDRAYAELRGVVQPERLACAAKRVRELERSGYSAAAPPVVIHRRDIDPDWADDPEYPEYRERRRPSAAAAEPAVLGTPGSATDSPIALTIRRSGDDPVTISVFATTQIETIKRRLVDMGLCDSLHHCDIKFSRISLENGRTLADYGIRTDTSVSYVPLFG